MANENNLQEEVVMYYIIESSNVEWLTRNISKYFEVYDNIHKDHSYVKAWVSTYAERPEIYFEIKGDTKSLENALEKLFNSHCGFPYAVIRPGNKEQCKRGFQTVERVITRHGKKLKTVLDGAFIQKVVV